MNQHVASEGLSEAVFEQVSPLGDRAVTGVSVRDLHARDKSHHPARWSDIGVFPNSPEDVADIVAIASRYRVPIVPFGVGSGLEGSAIPVEGGISLDTSRLYSIVEIRPDDMLVRAGAGVCRQELDSPLRDAGLFFPVDPGADASIGGVVSPGASGTNAVRFCALRENVLGLTVATADGHFVKTGSLARKSSSGCDLTRLFVGSEGTLGIVAEAILRVHPIPDDVYTVTGLATCAGAVSAVTDIRRAALAVGRVELPDDASIGAINRETLDVARLPTLFFKFHGNPEGISALSSLIEAIIANHGGTPSRRRRWWWWQRCCPP